jgi:hypothetical protein
VLLEGTAPAILLSYIQQRIVEGKTLTVLLTDDLLKKTLGLGGGVILRAKKKLQGLGIITIRKGRSGIESLYTLDMDLVISTVDGFFEKQKEQESGQKSAVFGLKSGFCFNNQNKKPTSTLHNGDLGDVCLPSFSNVDINVSQMENLMGSMGIPTPKILLIENALFGYTDGAPNQPKQRIEHYIYLYILNYLKLKSNSNHKNSKIKTSQLSEFQKIRVGNGQKPCLVELETLCPKASRFDVKRTKELYYALAHHRKVHGKPNLRLWIYQMQKLRLVDKRLPEEIVKVLQFHISQLGKPGCVWAFSTAGFRRYYDKIKDRMTKEVPQTYEKTEVLERVMRHLRSFRWPGVELLEVEACVADTLLKIADFKGRLIQRMDNGDKKKRKYMQAVLDAIGSSGRFAARWFEEVQKTTTWDGWKGRLSSLSFNVESSRFKKMGLEVARRYGCNWDALIGELYDED